jgi:hypothetical protein
MSFLGIGAKDDVNVALLERPEIVSVSESPALTAAEATVAQAQAKLVEAQAATAELKPDDFNLRSMILREACYAAKLDYELALANAVEVRGSIVKMVVAQDAPGLRALVRELSEILEPAEEVNAKIIEYQAETARKTGGRSQPPAGFAPLEATDLIYFWRKSARENGYLVD